MQYLDQYDVLAVAARVLRCGPATAVRRTNLDALDQVLTDVRRTGGLPEAAADLLTGLVRVRPFDGPNRVIAVAVVLQFTAVNDAELRLEPVEELDDLLDRVTADEVAADEVVAFIQERLDPGFAPEDVTAEDLQDRLRWDLPFEDEVERLVQSQVNAGFTVGDEIWSGVGMFERFSDRARRVVVLAQEEARMLNHNYIGTEHLLLGLIHEGQGAAAKVLTRLGISASAVRDTVHEIIGRGGQASPSGTIPFTPRAKTVLEHAHYDARILGADQIDTEHLLLGLIREGEGVAAQVLAKLGGDLQDIRRKMTDWLGHRQRVEAAVSEFLTDDARRSDTSAWVAHGRRRHLLAELTRLLDEDERLHDNNRRLAEENVDLHAEVARLRDLLRRHGIDPDT